VAYIRGPAGAIAFKAYGFTPLQPVPADASP